MTILDIYHFFLSILYDLKNFQDADLISLFFRLLVVYFAVILFYKVLCLLWRIFQETFSGLIYWVGRILSAPYRIPRKAFRNASQRRRIRKIAREREQERQRWEAQQQAEAAQRQREAEVFEKIMND